MVSTIRTDSALGFGIYVYIYLFHMPAMILLSGLFSKPEVNPKALKSTLQLIAVWLIWEAIWAGIHGLVEQQAPGQNFLVSPAWTLWFLVTLATMRVLLPFIAQLKHPLIFSIVVSLLGPVLPAIGVQFSAARTLAFLPFFVVGWLIRERGWLSGDWFMQTQTRVRIAGWAVLGGVALLIASFSALGDGLKQFWRIDKWLTHRDSYEWLFAHAPIGGWSPEGAGFPGWIATSLSGVLVSAVLLVVASILTLAVLFVVPRGHSVITIWGARTLYVYLLHGVIVWFMCELGVIDSFGQYGVFGLLALVALACALAMLLSMTWVTRVFWRLIEPRFEWIYGKAPAPAAPQTREVPAPAELPVVSLLPEAAPVPDTAEPVVATAATEVPGSSDLPETPPEEAPGLQPQD